MKKGKIAIIILIILLVAAVSYIIFTRYTTAKQQEQLAIFQQGALSGYQQAVLQLMQQASTCQPVPLYFNNQTTSVIAVECLQKTQPTQ